MAIIVNQIQTLWRGNAGNLVASQNQVISGFMGVGRSASASGRQVSIAEQQMRAFGTTLRYAFAGTVIFGVTSLIGKLNQLQQQMGLISAIAGPSGTNLGRGGLTDLEDALSSKAVAARTNLSELNDATINFLSTVQGAKGSDIPAIITQIGLTAKLSQTPAEDLTKAITTLNIAAGRPNNLRTINGLLREWFQLISQAPGGIAAAPQIAQQLGPLAAVGRLGGLTPEQLFGFSLGSLRFGATPSTALRGTQYFLQSLFQPGKGQSKVLAQAGLTPQVFQQVGGAQFARMYLQHLADLGTVPTRRQATQFGAITDQTTALDSEAALAPNQNIPGLTVEQQQFLRGSIGRIHGIRTAAVLLSQLTHRGTVSSLDEVLRVMTDLNKGVGPQAKQLQKAIERYRNETPLQGAAIALDTLRQTVGRDAAHILNPVSGALETGAGGLTGHKNVRHGLEIGAAAFLTALGVRSFRRRGLPGVFGLGNIAGQGFVTEQAIAAAGGAGGHRSGQTPLDSLYVTVVGQVFGGGGGGTGGGGAPGGGIPPIIATGTRFGPLARLGVAGAAALVTSYELKQHSSWVARNDNWHSLLGARAGINAAIHFGRSLNPFHHAAAQEAAVNWGAYPRASRAVAGVLNRRFFNPSLQGFSNLFSGMAGITGPPDAQLGFPDMLAPQVRGLHAAQRAAQNFKFRAEGDLVIQILAKDPDTGSVRKKRVHVPASAYSGGAVPSTRGKRKSIKADFTGKH